MRTAGSGSVAKGVSPPSPAARQRSGAEVQERGTYSSRSTAACPRRPAWTGWTAPWAFSILPAVPVYRRWRPTVPVPFFTSRAPGPPAPWSHRSSRTRPASRSARPSRCCMPSGAASPAHSAVVRQFLRGRSDTTAARAPTASSDAGVRPARTAPPSGSSGSRTPPAGGQGLRWDLRPSPDLQSSHTGDQRWPHPSPQRVGVARRPPAVPCQEDMCNVAKSGGSSSTSGGRSYCCRETTGPGSG